MLCSINIYANSVFNLRNTYEHRFVCSLLKYWLLRAQLIQCRTKSKEMSSKTSKVSI